MELNRNRYLDVLESWAKSQKPKPLLLWGARQVGKTHLMLKAAERFFGEHYYLNFERDKQLALLFLAIKIHLEHLLQQRPQITLI